MGLSNYGFYSKFNVYILRGLFGQNKTKQMKIKWVRTLLLFHQVAMIAGTTDMDNEGDLGPNCNKTYFMMNEVRTATLGRVF